MEKSDIDMRVERVDIGEGGISDACRRVAIVQHLPYVMTAITHNIPSFSGSRDSYMFRFGGMCKDHNSKADCEH